MEQNEPRCRTELCGTAAPGCARPQQDLPSGIAQPRAAVPHPELPPHLKEPSAGAVAASSCRHALNSCSQRQWRQAGRSLRSRVAGNRPSHGTRLQREPGPSSESSGLLRNCLRQKPRRFSFRWRRPNSGMWRTICRWSNRREKQPVPNGPPVLFVLSPLFLTESLKRVPWLRGLQPRSLHNARGPLPIAWLQTAQPRHNGWQTPL